MRAFRKLLFAALIIAPTFLPTQTRANGLIDWIIGLFDKDDKKGSGNNGNQNGNNGDNGNHYGNDKDTGKGNSVPLDGGIVFLFAAGLGLGTKMIYDANKKKLIANSTI
ncbi:PID-CTERM protein-sorting domain-containing protein [Flavitalea flava]